MPRAGVMSHNPFQFSTGHNEARKRVDAPFELRARLKNEIEEIDKRLIEACRDQKSYLIDSLTRLRADKAAELDRLRA
jgi:hypothetical protein